MPYLKQALAQCQVPLNAWLGAYLPHQHELDPMPALRALQDSGLRMALPVMPVDGLDGHMMFRSWRVDDWDNLRPGRHRIPVPQHGIEVTPEALLIPLVAFTRYGARLGYGGGWYDRTLRFLRKTNPGIPAIGLAFACQGADILPVDPWDEPLTAIVTEREVVWPEASLHCSVNNSHKKITASIFEL